MQAATFTAGSVDIMTMPEPEPGTGQALVRTHACGLCASDKHFLDSGGEIAELSRSMGGPYAALDPATPFVPGHEFVGEVLDYGPGSARPVKPGQRVTSIPVMRAGGAHAVVGFSHDCPGGFGEYMLLDENMMFAVPDSMPDAHATLIEPLAVGFEHARRGRPEAGDVALVLGCGIIGLGVIARLKMMAVGAIVAADFQPDRRDLALAMGADVAIDPRSEDPYAPLSALGGRSVNLIYENVGLPGMLQKIMQSAPFDGRIVMGGYCMQEESLYVFGGQNKRLTLHFAGGEEPEDMALAMRAIDEGRFPTERLIGDTIGLAGVSDAIRTMSDPGAPVRTVVDPRRA